MIWIGISIIIGSIIIYVGINELAEKMDNNKKNK